MLASDTVSHTVSHIVSDDVSDAGANRNSYAVSDPLHAVSYMGSLAAC